MHLVQVVKDPSGQSFIFAQHIHHRFVTNGQPAELAGIKSLAEDMMANLKSSFANLRVP